MTTIWRRGDDFVDIDDMLFDELDLSWLLRRLLPLSLRQLLRWPLQRPGRLLRLQLRHDHESEAARRAQRTKSSRRGGRRLLVVVILRLLATKKASMPTVHGFGGFRIAQIHRLRYFIYGWRVKIGEIACIGRCYNNLRRTSLGHSADKNWGIAQILFPF